MNQADKRKVIGEIIKKIRLSRGMDQHDVAEKLGVGQVAVSNMETRGIVSLFKLLEVAKVLQVDSVTLGNICGILMQDDPSDYILNFDIKTTTQYYQAK